MFRFCSGTRGGKRDERVRLGGTERRGKSARQTDRIAVFVESIASVGWHIYGVYGMIMYSGMVCDLRYDPSPQRLGHVLESKHPWKHYIYAVIRGSR